MKKSFWLKIKASAVFSFPSNELQKIEKAQSWFQDLFIEDTLIGKLNIKYHIL